MAVTEADRLRAALSDVDCPADKNRLVDRARRSGADDTRKMCRLNNCTPPFPDTRRPLAR
jgi:hypothetical protein